MKSDRFIICAALIAAMSGCADRGGSLVSALAGPPAQRVEIGQRPSAQPALTIGSFNLKRGGEESLAASDESGLRSAIKQLFPGSTFKYSGSLNATFLSTINVLVIGVATGSQTAITPLTTNEQSALLRFVKTGHGAVLFTDNDLQFEASSLSMLAPFGLHSNGVLDGNQTATFIGSNPIMTGPAGTAQQLDTQWPGWFDGLGQSVDLANYSANSQPALAYIAAGQLRTGSGPAVFFADSSIMVDGQRTMNDQIAILNALALR